MLQKPDRNPTNATLVDVLDQALLDVQHAKENRVTGNLDLAVEQLESASMSLIEAIKKLSAPAPNGRYGYLHGREPRTIELQRPATLGELSCIKMGLLQIAYPIAGILIDNYFCERDGISVQELCNMTGYDESSVTKSLKHLADGRLKVKGYEINGPSSEGKYGLIKA